MLNMVKQQRPGKKEEYSSCFIYAVDARAGSSKGLEGAFLFRYACKSC